MASFRFGAGRRADAGLFRGEFRRFMETGESPAVNKPIEFQAIHKKGHGFPVELVISPMRLEDRWTFSAFVRDITERKEI